MRAGEAPTPIYESQGEDAGNGSIMRLAPIPVAYHRDSDVACDLAAQSSLTTHPGPLAAEACAFMAFLIVRAINWPTSGASGGGNKGGAGDDPKGFLDTCVEEYTQKLEARIETLTVQAAEAEAEAGEEMNAAAADGGGTRVRSTFLNRFRPASAPSPPAPPKKSNPAAKSLEAAREIQRLMRSTEPDDSCERCWNWRAEDLQVVQTCVRRGYSYNGYPVSPGYFGSFSMDGLAMALWSIYHSDSFGATVERCVNLLGDSDSTASVAGQIAGAMYGYSGIDQAMLRNLAQWDDGDTLLRAVLLYHINA
mmetsp:Transcript_48169/g.134643  ORF Transcript_48169/g.134643 Transcript_48169/m.134643 type:complete len:308 (-) Transcript_48169:420-1343(-)